MKKLLVTIFILLSFSFSNKLLAAKFSDGYIVKNGDTIQCQIKIQQQIQGLCQECLQNVILIKDSTGKETNYKATELDGFGFFYYKEQYTFVSKELIKGEPPVFMRVEILGGKLNLYSFMGEMYMNNRASALIHFLIEKRNKETIVFKNGALFNSKRMKEFFSDEPEILAIYKKEYPTFWELPDFIKLVNSKK